MTTKAWICGGVVALAAISIASIGFHYRRSAQAPQSLLIDHLPQNSSTTGATTDPDRIALAASPVGAALPRPDARNKRIAMPPDEAPVAKTLESLKSYADAGHPAASCRLAIDLNKCAQSSIAMRTADMLATRSSGPSEAQSLNLASFLIESAARSEAICAGVSEGQVADIFRYQINAAKAYPRAGRWLAHSPALDRVNFLSQIEYWYQYKEMASIYFNESLRAARMADLVSLIYVHRTASFGSPIPYRDPDAALFLALTEKAENLGVALPSDIINEKRRLQSDSSLVSKVHDWERQLDGFGWNNSHLSYSVDLGSFSISPSLEICK